MDSIEAITKWIAYQISRNNLRINCKLFNLCACLYGELSFFHWIRVCSIIDFFVLKF